MLGMVSLDPVSMRHYAIMSMNAPFHAKSLVAPLRTLTVLGLLALVAGVRGEVSTVSPFLPPGGANAGGQEAGALELRGVMVANGESFFNILDTGTKKSVWLSINQGGRDFVVRSHEASNQTDAVVVDYQGKQVKLTLVKAKTGKAAAPQIAPPQAAAAMAAAGAPAARPGPPPPQGPVSPVVLNPTPADEARRLEDFRNEVLRRRLQRQQEADQKARPAQQGGRQQ